MKYLWEAEDAKPGLLVEYTKTNAENRFAVLGYCYREAVQYRTVTDLTDGLQLFHGSEEQLIEFLNRGYSPVTTPVQAFKLVAQRADQ